MASWAPRPGSSRRAAAVALRLVRRPDFVAEAGAFVALRPLRRLDRDRRRIRRAARRPPAYPRITAAGDRLAPLASSPAANPLEGYSP